MSSFQIKKTSDEEYVLATIQDLRVKVRDETDPRVAMNLKRIIKKLEKGFDEEYKNKIEEKDSLIKGKNENKEYIPKEKEINDFILKNFKCVVTGEASPIISEKTIEIDESTIVRSVLSFRCKLCDKKSYYPWEENYLVEIKKHAIEHLKNGKKDRKLV